MAQPPRFAARTKIITDLSISEGSRLLYLFLDDQAHGEARLAMKRLRIAVMMGLSMREVSYRLRNLENAGYVATKRTRGGNVYDLLLHACALPDVHACSPTSARPCTSNLIEQETTRTSPTPPLKKERCQWCRGRGARPGACAGSCPGCDGTGIADYRVRAASA